VVNDVGGIQAPTYPYFKDHHINMLCKEDAQGCMMAHRQGDALVSDVLTLARREQATALAT
jgi:hypothetical protein